MRGDVVRDFEAMGGEGYACGIGMGKLAMEEICVEIVGACDEGFVGSSNDVVLLSVFELNARSRREAKVFVVVEIGPDTVMFEAPSRAEELARHPLDDEHVGEEQRLDPAHDAAFSFPRNFCYRSYGNSGFTNG